MPLGSPGSGKSIVQLEPQQVVLRMKPGDTLTVPYKYLHRKPPPGYDVKDFLVQTSEYKKLGVNLPLIKIFVDATGQKRSKLSNVMQSGKVKKSILKSR
ncbi:hypothetical protein COOONC_04025 [Cooperia oncophora]